MNKPQTVDFFGLEKDIENNSLKPIYLIYGEENYLHNLIQNTIRNYFNDNKKPVNYELFYGENIDFNGLVISIKSLPLGIEKQVVIIKNFERLSSAYAKKLEYLIKNKSFQDNAITIFIFSLNKKLPTNIPLAKIRQFGKIISLKKPKSYQVKQWINKRLNEKRMKILPDALYYLQRLTDNDLSRIDNEIEKILCYLGEERLNITKEDIINNFFGSEKGNIFSFVDAIGERKTREAIALLKILNENEYHPLSILAMISRQLKLILRAKFYNGNQKKIKGDTNLPPFVINNLIKQSQKYQIDRLKSSFNHLLDAEKKIKTGHFSPVMVLEQLVIKITK